MKLRRPRLADKETVLEMMAEFENISRPHDGGFWDAENFCMKSGWKVIRIKKWGLTCLKDGFLQFS